MNDDNPQQTIVWVARAVAYVAYAYIVVVQIILVQGFLLLLLGANTGSSYVDWAYRSLERVMAPFRGIFESVDLTGRAVLDTSVLFAMVMYAILGLVVHSLLDWLTYRLHRLEAKRLCDEARAEAETAAMHVAAYGVPGSGLQGYPSFGQPAPAAHAASPLVLDPQMPTTPQPARRPGPGPLSRRRPGTGRVDEFLTATGPDQATRCLAIPALTWRAHRRRDGSRYPSGIPIRAEADLADIIRIQAVDEVVFSYSDVAHTDVMHLASLVLATGASFRLLSPPPRC